MNTSLALAFLFFVGALFGWGLEFLFRNLISHSGPKGKILINPGFCKGPYLPIYGIGLVIMFCVCYLLGDRYSKIVVILIIAMLMTLIEFVGGVFLLKVLNMRLWDYRDNKFNVMGVICPTFSIIWGLLGGIYYLLIHPYITEMLIWLSNNLAFSFFVGLFYGVFALDLIDSIKDAFVIKKFGDNNEVVIKYEELKENIQNLRLQMAQKWKFFNQTIMDNKNLAHLLNEIEEIREDKKHIFKKEK